MPWRGLRAIWITMLVVTIAGALALLVATHVLHLHPIAVRSGSMTPALPVHTLLLVEEVAPATVRVGDVITFDPPGPATTTSHRVVSRELRNERWYFRTKGDANATPDDWRRGMDAPKAYQRGVTYGTRDALRTRWHVPFVGRIAELSQHDLLRRALFLVPLGLLALATVWRIWAPPHRGGSDAGALVRDDHAELDDWWPEAV